MAFRQLFPIKDTTIYSYYPDTNTGLDPIMEFSKQDENNAARILIQFDPAQVTQILSEIGPKPYKAYLRCYASEASSLATDMPIVVNQVAQEWVMGTGRLANVPTTSNGATWIGPKPGTTWFFDNIITTGSYLTGSNYVSGGGSWVIGNESTQVISQYTPQDLYIDITNQVTALNGFILRVSESVESDPNYQYQLSYFSRDTNTIYPPSLVFFWNDSVYNPYVTLSSQVINNQNFDVTIGNNDGVYYAEDNVQVQVFARDRYPQRQFVTSSLYEWNKMLTSQSFYQVIDVDTNDVIIPFNDPGTLISTTTGSYFQLDMNTFEPERYYQVQVKVNISGSSYIKATDSMTFKVSQTVFP